MSYPLLQQLQLGLSTLFAPMTYRVRASSNCLGKPFHTVTYTEAPSCEPTNIVETLSTGKDHVDDQIEQILCLSVI